MRPRGPLIGALIGALALVPACTKVYTGESPTSPGRVVGYEVEYRVTGTATAATIRYSNSEDGLSQVSSSLPWSTRIHSDRAVMFLSLEVQASGGAGTPFLNAQIYVDGVLLREASATSFFTPLVISATYRRR